jgi:DNA-binding NtrC family response regulator
MRPLDRKLIRPPSEAGQAGAGEPAVQQRGEKPGMLVVDDDHMVRVMVQLGLERDGFNVWLASNGREAIQLYRTYRNRIDVVLLDVRRPGADGPATLDALRNLNPEVLACFMSSDPGAYGPEELHQRGAAQFIVKPFRLDELANVLRRLTPGASAAPLPAGGSCRE